MTHEMNRADMITTTPSFFFPMRLIGAASVLALAGCGSAGTVAPNRYEPAKAAEVAMQTYDANQDGRLDEAELEKSPGLLVAFRRLDRDRDGFLSSAEIMERMEAYKTQSRLISTSVLVRSGRGPAPNVAVTMELEPFIGENLPPYTGVTGEAGVADVKVEGVEGFAGLLPPGFYRVRLVTAVGSAAEVIRGCELADDIPSSRQFVFSLDAKKTRKRRR